MKLINESSKQYPILNVTAADVQGADGAGADPLQTQIRQVLAVAQVQMLQTAQPGEETGGGHMSRAPRAPDSEQSRILLRDPHDGSVRDAAAVADVQLSECARAAVDEELDSSIAHPEKHTHTHTHVRGCEEGLHRCSTKRRRPAAEGEVQVLQVLQGGEGSDASIRQPGALGGVDPVEAWGASAQSLPASIRQLVVPCESALMGEVHLYDAVRAQSSTLGKNPHPPVQRC